MHVIPRQRTSSETMARPAHDDDAVSFDGMRERGLAGAVNAWSHVFLVADEGAAHDLVDATRHVLEQLAATHRGSYAGWHVAPAVRDRTRPHR